MKKLLVLLVTAICLTCLSLSAMAAAITLGDTMPGFTVETINGEPFTLSKALEEKDLVMINVWASWCGPCMNEFPHLQEAYEKYQDRVEILALSCESSDDAQKIQSVIDKYGLTFPVGSDTIGVAYAFGVTSIPTSILVDRYGTISLVISGAMPNAATVEELFDFYLSDAYTESRLLTSLPQTRPASVKLSSEKELADALNVAGGQLTFTNPGDKYSWPMTVTSLDDRTCVVSSNAAMTSTDAVVSMKLNVQADDVLAYDFRTSTEVSFDKLLLKVNGKTVKVFSGERDWMSYAYAFEAAGTYDVQLVYSKDYAGDGGEDAVWLDNIRVLSGEAAAEALAANPVYPVAEEITLQLTGDNVREVAVNDPLNALESIFGSVRYYIVSGSQVKLEATLTREVDPEDAVLVEFLSNVSLPMSLLATENGYAYNAKTYSSATVGIPFAYTMLMPGEEGSNRTVVYFAGEAEANKFVKEFLADESGVSHATWSYLEAADPVYEVKVVNEDGLPLSGVMLQACTDTLCAVYVTDENGAVSFTAEKPYAYEIHVMNAPAGYQGDPETYTLPVNGGSISITLKQE